MDAAALRGRFPTETKFEPAVCVGTLLLRALAAVDVNEGGKRPYLPPRWRIIKPNRIDEHNKIARKRTAEYPNTWLRP